MKSSKPFIYLHLFVALLSLSGCMEELSSNSAKPAGQQTDAASLKKFQGAEIDEATALESAIELSKKYAELSDEMSRMKLEQQNLINENQRLAKLKAEIELELNQAKKELTEANDLLVEMRVELNNWKVDVLGFRDEIRLANKVQLETLAKILTVLGGESTEAADEPTAQAK